MAYAFAAACLGWVATSCLLAWLLTRLLTSQHEERQAHRIEIDGLTRSHAEQLERLSQAHRQEVANLCQRLQAPEIAVAEHLGQNAPPDPPPVDLENDLALISERERQMREFAEELAAEH